MNRKENNIESEVIWDVCRCVSPFFSMEIYAQLINNVLIMDFLNEWKKKDGGSFDVDAFRICFVNQS